MASLIKNQVLKHLTKFFKDLAPEQLQLSAFKGSCELSNLQLEEKVLMDMLSFPAWVRINKAECDQLSIKIPWTKIKSVPIQMNLNEVTVEVEVCEDFRDIESIGDDDINNLTSLVNSQVAGKYGFVDRVIDGITVAVNNILIVFKSKLMSATFNLSRVLLESRCPNWKQGELSLTRIKDTKKGQILLFKVVDWQTMRLEAKCLTDPQQAPLRLITNHAQCRLTIKKSLDDCSVVAARIFVIFEDILWVLTFAQFTSAASFVEYVFSLIKRSPVSKKTGLLQDNQSGGGSSSSSCQTPTPNTSLSFNTSTLSSTSTIPTHLSSRSTPVHSSMNKQDGKPPLLTGNLSSASLLEQKFLCYDLVETSLHLYIDKVDAHLYDDIEINPGSGNSRETGGALQMTLDSIQVDCYPYSRAISDRKHWYKWFDPSPSSRKQWIKNHFAEFDLLKARKFNYDLQQETAGSYKSDLDTESGVNNVIKSEQKTDFSSTRKMIPTGADEQLLSLTVLVKIKDYCMNCVATSQSARGINVNKFIQTDKDYQMPSEMPALYLELNYFYYFDAINRMMVYENVPDPLAFMHLSPTKLLFDSPTLVFLNSFHVNLSKAFVHLNDIFPQETTTPSIECRVEILMPQIILPAKKSQVDQTSDVTLTSSLLVKSGKITLCSSIHDRDVMSKLISSIERLKENPCQPINIGGLQGNSFTRRENSCTDDWTRVWNESLVGGLSDRHSEKKKLWAIQFEPVWMDFMNYDVDQLASSQRLEPIVEPVNAYAFIHLDLSSTFPSQFSSDKSTEETLTDKRDVISILFSVLDGSILANMDKIQFGFLQRLGMHVEKLIQQVKQDASSVIQLDTVVENTLEINLTAYIKEIKARLILDKKINNVTDAEKENPRNITYESFTKSLPGTGGQPLTPSKPAGFFNTLTGISNPFEDAKQKVDEFNGRQTNEYQTAAVIDGSLLDDDADLDECVEVADDACLLFKEETEPEKSEPRPVSGDVLPNEPTCIQQSDASTAITKSSQVQGDSSLGGGCGSLRSVGKSPIEESLLINLDEIEQSSQLFAKMDIKPQQQSQNLNQSQISEKSNTTTNQQQDIETESISYLELSMSKLMVRRITETKRRQKF
uniref:UHRF1-binding protein 1-like n=1 Tax=Aceria tosichella TaxID=561515 RepID=A0A6G1SDC2_9ACAR